MSLTSPTEVLLYSEHVPANPILREARWFWPIVLFPYAAEGAHTRSFTGRTTLKDVKASFSRAVVDLNEEELVVRGRFTRRKHLVVPIDEIREVDVVEGKPGLVELRFGDAKWGRLAQVVTSGSPRGSRHRVILNVNDTESWLQEIARRVR
jgi:hypothetical protein